jgi:hypothetical protein
MKKQFSIAMAVCMFAAVAQPALAAWAVVRAPGGRPIVARQYLGTGAAKKQALEDCAKLYGNCAVIETANTACLSLANDGKNWGVGKAYTKPKADIKALEACAAVTSRQCKVVHNFCGN